MRNFTRFVFIFLILFAGCKQTNFNDPTVKIETNFGNIFVELYPEKAPKTVAAFLSYVGSGLYKEASFYRILKKEDQPSSSFKSELIQGGIWQTKPRELQSLKGIPHENTNVSGLLHEDGMISMARTDTGTATSEFFIVISKQKAYDYGGAANADGQGFAAFGKVVKGMDVVRSIHRQPNDETSFVHPVEITNITKVSD
ncbi:peptidylprolyl isomerase [soil metagenome]